MADLIEREPTKEEIETLGKMDTVDPENVAPVEVIEHGNVC